MRWFAVAACAGLVLGAAAQARAETVQAPPAAATPAEPVTPVKTALVRRYLQAIHYEKLVDGMMASMLPVMAETATRGHAVPPAQQEMVVQIVRETMREKITPEIIERLIPIYAATFTEAELQSMVAFYESPTGQAVMAKAPSLGPQAAQILRSLMPEMQGELARRICERLNCNADPKTKPKPS
jgi:hypothetical protein